LVKVLYEQKNEFWVIKRKFNSN